jgi:hypothetical protein
MSQLPTGWPKRWPPSAARHGLRCRAGSVPMSALSAADSPACGPPSCASRPGRLAGGGAGKARCGSGASGRNGGCMLTWSTKYPSLRRWFGDSEASRLVQASEQAVADIAGFCQQHAIDADIRLGGAVYAASNPAQIGRLAPVLSMLQEHGSIAGPPCPRPKPARSVALPCCRTATQRAGRQPATGQAGTGTAARGQRNGRAGA